MAPPAARTDLPQAVASRLANLSQRVRIQTIARKLRSSLFTDEEKDQVPETPEELAQLSEVFARLREFTIERATIELALEAGFLDYGEYRSLRREIGEPIDDSNMRPAPNWDFESGKLVFEGEVVRRIGPQAKNVRLILDVFQEEGWPSCIDNPLPGGADSPKLRDTVRNLNNSIVVLRFFSYQFATRVRWEV